MDKCITFIRHAESTFNANNDQSRNVPLTDNGKTQAGFLDGDYDIVVCSTLRRTRQTLDYSKIKYANIVFTELCREFKDNQPSNYYSGEQIIEETDEEFDERILKFFNYLNALSLKYPRICIVTHSVLLRRMTGKWFNNAFYWKFHNLDYIKNYIESKKDDK